MAGRALPSPAPTVSLRAQVALVIAALSLLPNAIMAAAMVLPALGGVGVARELWLAAALWAAAVVALSALIGYLASRQLLAPLSRLTAEVAALPATSERLAAARLPARADEPPEARALRLSFNRLLERIEREGEQRSAFTATLMHDLKTPLVAASHVLEVIRDQEELGREERVALIDRLLRENEALVELVQKLVDAHRVDREEIALARERLRVEELLETVRARLAPLAAERGVEVRLEGGAVTSGDRRELERALYNLLANAVRYARSRIVIEAFPGLVRIADDGPGLPAPLERLAQPYNGRPVEIAGSRYTAGSGGLGLFIARRILEAHGGRLVCESSSPRGTVLLAYLGAEA